MQDQGFAADPGPEEIDVPHHSTRCDVCSTNIPNAHWERHVRGQRHAKASTFVALQAAIDESETDKNGVVISPGELDFGFEEATSRNTAWTMEVNIQNTNATKIKLVEARLASQMSSRQATTGYVSCNLPEKAYLTNSQLRTGPPCQGQSDDA